MTVRDQRYQTYTNCVHFKLLNFNNYSIVHSVKTAHTTTSKEKIRGNSQHPRCPRANVVSVQFHLRSINQHQMSRLVTSFAYRWMNSLRGSTFSPIRVVKSSSAYTASSMVTWRRVRVSGFMVVSQS